MTGPNGAARSRLAVAKSPVERDLAARRPVDPAMAGDRAVDQRDHAFGQPGDLVGLEGRARRSGPARRGRHGRRRSTAMLDLTLVTRAPLAGWRSAAGRADIVAGEREMHVVAIAADRSAGWPIAVGNGQRAVDAEVAVTEQPGARWRR